MREIDVEQLGWTTLDRYTARHKVSKRTVIDRFIRSGQLPIVKVGRVWLIPLATADRLMCQRQRKRQVAA